MEPKKVKHQRKVVDGGSAADGGSSVPRKDWLFCLLLAFISVLLYLPSTRFDFINYDDGSYVYENPRVKQGLSLRSLQWALTTFEAANWHPLTWISHLADVQLHGMKAGGHHLTNVVLHAVNSVVIFLALSLLTQRKLPSFWIALIFAVHPLNVQSVAWVAERKNLLSTLFWWTTLWAYGRYASNTSRTNYLFVFICFALGLMAKPMLVTLPFVLLLLDVWPLKRAGATVNFPWKQWKGLVLEKVPLFLLVIFSCLITLKVQRMGGAMGSSGELPMDIRILNAWRSYVEYLEKLFCPARLSIFDPHPGPGISRPAAFLSGFFLVAVSGGVLFFLRRFPQLFTGWFWFLGTLVPVIGIVQVGAQSLADRYMYVPMIGILLMVAWGAISVLQKYLVSSGVRFALIAISLGLAMPLFLVSRGELAHWKSSETIFRHALKNTKNNYVAHNNLGLALMDQKRNSEALEQFREAVRIKPNYPEAHNNLGTALAGLEQHEAAMPHYEIALRLFPESRRKAEIYYNAGQSLIPQRKYEEAAGYYLEAVRIQPDHFQAHNNLGSLYFMLKDPDRAEFHYSRALEIRSDGITYFNLGMVMKEKGNRQRAMELFRQALELNPGHARARQELNSMEDRLQ